MGGWRRGCAACAAIASPGAGKSRSTTCSTPISGASQPRSEADIARQPGRWLVFADKGGVGARLAEQLRARGDACAVVRVGSTFEDCGQGDYRIDPGRPEDMLRLIQAVVGPDRSPVPRHRPPVEPRRTAAGRAERGALRAAQEPGLLSIVWLVQAWDRVAPDQSARLFLVTRGAQSVADRPEPVAIAQAPAIGLGRVIAGEYPRLRCKLVDLDPAADDGGVGSLVRRDPVRGRRGRGRLCAACERYVHRYLPAPGLPPEGERGPTEAGVPYRLAARRPGTLDGLVLQTLRRRPPGPGEVEIEVVAAGLNFSDVMKALATYPGLPDGPVPLGAECSGRITAVGRGRRPSCTSATRCWRSPASPSAAMSSRRAELVAIKPPGLSFEEAATLPIAFLTASYALEYLGRLGPGESVLIHSASGGVGLAAIQLARRAGAQVFATAGTPRSASTCGRWGSTASWTRGRWTSPTRCSSAPAAAAWM